MVSVVISVNAISPTYQKPEFYGYGKIFLPPLLIGIAKIKKNTDIVSMAVGRTNSMQELINLMEHTYGETIIGTDINLIKHLFHYLKFENIEFRFEYEEDIMTVIVNSVLQDFVELNVLGFEEGTSRRAKIKFEVVNVLYQFEVIIEDIRGSIVKIKIPSELQAAEMRNHRRVVVDDLFMDFVILFKSFKGGQFLSGENIHAERRFTHLFRELKKDLPDLSLMNKILTDYIMNISQEYEIVIYKEEDEHSFLREVFATDTTKSIFIEDCSDLNNYFKPSDHLNSMTYSNVYNNKLASDGEFKTKKFFEKMQKTELRNFMVSYIISPLTLFDKVIGHIKVYTTAMDKHILSKYHCEFLHEMTEIASYGFTKLSIRGNNFNTLYTNTKIVDISASGLLFEISDENLYLYLKKHNAIKMYIPIGKNILNISGEILRFFKVDDEYETVYRMGVLFFNSSPDDLYHLENYIYEKRGNVLSE